MAKVYIKEKMDYIPHALSIKQENEKKNILNCEVISKYPLNENIKEDLIKYLSQKYQKEIKLKETINDELIGGIKVIVQNEVIDYTIDSTLTNLKNTIKG